MATQAQNLTPLTVQEVAALYWRMLETQSNAGLTWDMYRRIPNELKELCPCQRKIRHVRRTDAVLLDTYRVYSEQAAISALEKLGFNLFSELTTRGYAGAYAAWYRALRQYYRAVCASNYYR